MHVIVLTRHVYFLASFFLHVSLAVVTGIALNANVQVVGGLATLSLAVVGALTLLGLLAFDLNRTRAGQAYFCFVCKIWFELSLMSLLMVLHIATFLIVLSQNREHTCVAAASDDGNPCAALQLIWAFQISVVIIVLSYVMFLASVSLKHYTNTPRVFFAAVRDFPWGLHNAGSHPKVFDPHRPINFPNSNLPTFDQTFPDVHKALEEGHGRHPYPPHAHRSWR